MPPQALTSMQGPGLCPLIDLPGDLPGTPRRCNLCYQGLILVWMNLFHCLQESSLDRRKEDSAEVTRV